MSIVAWAPLRVAGAVERLDLPGADPRLVAGALDDLARINRLFFGTRLTLAAAGDLLGEAPAGERVFLLDAGCGRGDMAVALARWSRAKGLDARVLALDASPTIAGIARARFGAEIDVGVDDVLALGQPDGSVDVAACSLLLHHFEPDDVVRALGELRRVSRRGVIVNDLVRGPLGLIGAHGVARLLTRNPITRFDAVLSARRAYTRGELLDLVNAAGLRPVKVRGALGYRIAVSAVSA